MTLCHIYFFYENSLKKLIILVSYDSLYFSQKKEGVTGRFQMKNGIINVNKYFTRKY